MHLFTVLVVPPTLAGPSMTFLATLLALFFFDYCFTLVNAAIHAYMVRENGFMALGAERDVRQMEMMMGSSHIPS